MRGIDTLGYVGFTTRNIEGWKTFAPQVLGLQVAQELEDGTLVLRADQHRRRIVLHPGDTDAVAYLGWECRNPEDLDNVRKALRAAHVPFEEASVAAAEASAVKAMIRFRDADGLWIEAYFGPTLMVHDPFVSPVGARPFVMSEQGLGHVVMATSRYREQIAFYQDVLSFRITDYLEISGLNREAVFLRVNHRHHSLALIDMPPAHGNFHHLLLEMSSLDEVGFAYQRAKAAGAHIVIDLGRHVNDNMLSFYVTTPSGWAVEIGWGGIQIDDETWHVTHYPTNSSWGHTFSMPPHAAGG
ncbi:VOC family protein [Xanthomonas campestris pv. phormiicola]|nr:VOC family protein [Xanthomonas campestris pv. phormiicola]UYC16288.1 VOC family protein [Xanthomonas campestris pv. phormiicola]